MEKKLKDYLHLYLGCELVIEGSNDIYKLTPYWLNWFIDHPVEFSFNKLVLRSLLDMTEDEGLEASEIMGAFTPSYFIEAIKSQSRFVIDYRYSFELTKYLLSKHFDLFGLIEAGLAIELTGGKTKD